MFPIVSSRSVASLEIVKMYKMRKNSRERNSRSCFYELLDKKKKKKSFFRGWEQFQCSVFYTSGIVRQNMYISGAGESMIKESLILGPITCQYSKWYVILPNTRNPILYRLNLHIVFCFVITS